MILGHIYIVEVIALLFYGAIFLGCARLVRRYPETISGINTMRKEERNKLNLPKIGAFVAKWLNVSAAVAFLAILIPKRDLRWQVACFVPLFLLLLCAAYLTKYKHTRFAQEGVTNEAKRENEDR